MKAASGLTIPRIRTYRSAAPRSVGVPAGQGATVVEALEANARRRPQQPAMRWRSAGGGWETATWSDYVHRVHRVAAGLAGIGVRAGERVAILSANRPEWHLFDLGGLTNGNVTVPVYPTSSPEQVSYALGHSAAVACFVDSHAQLGKVLQIRDRVPALRHVVLADGTRRASDSSIIGFEELSSLGDDLITRGRAAPGPGAAAVRPADLATIVYTSGTTGPPKGVMLTHDNIMWTARQVTPVYGIGEGERLLSFLPLSHIAERMMSEFLPVAVTGETWFARSLATVAEDLTACRPTIFLAVPRVWEKLRQGVQDNLERQPLPLRLSVARYVELGLQTVDARQEGRSANWTVAGVHAALDRTVGAAVRHQLGLDRARVVVSAAAPVHPDLVRWFCAIGLPLLQIYGQTEDCGPTTGSRPDDNRIGTVGKPLPGIAVRLAADGEILVQGGNVCLGYLDDEAATADLIDAEGWMHSGDTGAFEADGSLRVVGRKKDLIITAAGQNVAPQDIETDLCEDALISEAVVVGEGRRYLGALVALDPDELTRWARRHHKLDDYEALAADPDLEAEIAAVVDKVNGRRSHAEGIRRFRILPHELTAARGELTPTMKVRRSVVYERYAEAIEEMYASG